MLVDMDVPVLIFTDADGVTVHNQFSSAVDILFVLFVGVNVNGPQAAGGIVNCTSGLLSNVPVRVVSCTHPSTEVVRSRNVNTESAVDLFSDNLSLGVPKVESDTVTVLTLLMFHLNVAVPPLCMLVLVSVTLSLGHRLVTGMAKMERGLGYTLMLRCIESLHPEPAVITSLAR